MQRSSAKKTRILEHFQKIDQLTVSHKPYEKCVDDLCEWLLRNDRVQDDLTTRLLFVKEPKEINARIITKEPLTLAGVAEAVYLLNTFTEIKYDSKQFDGMSIGPNETILELSGTAVELLAYERTVLNIMQRLSGIATATNTLVEEIKKLKLRSVPLIASTRKTPWTLLDKKAVALGGGVTHRLNLSDGVLVKDNHLVIVNELYGMKDESARALKTLEILTANKNSLLIEIEIENPESIEALIRTVQSTHNKYTLCIMLDNFSAADAKKTLDNLHKKYDLSKVIFEASGGINRKNILDWAETGVDIISLGALTHSVQAVDLSLEIV